MTGYTDLQASILGTMHRSDLSSDVAGFITRGEERINARLNSRMAEQEATLTGVIGSRYINLPAGFAAPIDLWMNTYPPRQEVVFMPPENLPVKNAIGNGQPRYYTIDGSKIGLDIPCDVAYDFTFRYKGRYNLAVTGDNDINTNYPSVYLYSALIEGAIHIHNDVKLQTWSSMFTEAMAQCAIQESANRSDSTLVVDFVTTRKANILSGGA